MAILITRIIAKRTQFSEAPKRYWELWSEARASPVSVLEGDLKEAHWLEGEAKKLRDFMLRMSERQEKTLDIPAVVEAVQDGKYYQVARVVKGPPVSPEEQDWIDEMASRIRQQVAEIQSVQQARIDALKGELAGKQRRIDKLVAMIQTQQARITALESEADQATAENLPAESPAESVAEDEEDGAWSAAKLFHPVDPALADEDADDVPVPPRPSVDEAEMPTSEIRTERLMHPHKPQVILCYEANMDLTPDSEYLEVLSAFIETCKGSQYVNYFESGLSKFRVYRLFRAGLLERSVETFDKMRPSAAGELWHRRHATSPAEVPQQESVIDPPQAAPPREPVSLRSLLVGAAESAADADSRPDERVPPQEDEDAQRLADDSDDLLDLSIIATIIGAVESDVKLIEAMMKNGWACTFDDLKDVFEDDKNVFVRVIIDDINDRAQDEMDDNLLELEGGRWEIHEYYRDAIETILAHPDQYRQQID